MTATYSIEPRPCTLCEAERDGAFQAEADRVWPVVVERRRRKAEWNEFYDDWHAEHPEEQRMCFLFVADCGGDAIALCWACLTRITSRVYDQDGAMPGSATQWYAHERVE